MYEAGAKYAGERVQFGREIGKFQAIQSMIADNYADALACQAVTVGTALRRDAGLDHVVQGCAAKLICSEAAFRTADRTIQIFGGYGFSREYPLQRYYRDAKGLGIYGRTSEQIRVALGVTGLKEKKF
jgi:alkylation response protein AidB-like acyl-CoA dehydrogenase